jgi:excisionase family DNA binding protein
MPEQWVAVDEVANHLGVSRDTVYRWVENKDLPAHRVGRVWRFKLSQVDQWVEQQSATDDQREGAKDDRRH